MDRHQQEALGFMLERESGHVNDRYRLWRRVVKDGKEECVDPMSPPMEPEHC